MGRVTLTGIPGSHPVLAVQAMLDYKRIPYVRRDLPNHLHKRLLRLQGLIDEFEDFIASPVLGGEFTRAD